MTPQSPDPRLLALLEAIYGPGIDSMMTEIGLDRLVEITIAQIRQNLAEGGAA